MKKIIVAVDSFKGSLTSLEAGSAIAEGIHKVFPKTEVLVCPLADGGEGTVEALTQGMGGHIEKVSVCDPLGRAVLASYGIIDSDRLAIIEMSAAAGITLLSQEERNPLKTTSYGVGQIIKDAIEKGCRKFIVGIGGSATNDGGIGMLQVLGYGFLDNRGQEVPLGAQGLKLIEKITVDKVLPALAECSFQIACDVKNPLCGQEGCSAVFGPQKGATPAMMKDMDAWLYRYAKLTEEIFPKADMQKEGCGAAGGLGFAFLSYTNALLDSGISIVLKESRLENHIKDADLIITGEGRLDGQTVMGKAPIGVAKLAKKYQKKVIAFSGCVTSGARLCNDHGIDAFFPILRNLVSLEEAMDKTLARQNMIDTSEQVFRLIAMCDRNR